MAADASGPPQSHSPALVAPGWAYDRAGRLVFTRESGIPDPPLSTALRSTARSSLLGLIVGLAICLTAVSFGWDEVASAAAFGAYGMPQVRRRYRLRVAFAFAVTTAACLAAGILLGDGLRPPWDLFLPLAFALAVGSLAGTAAAYQRRRTGNQRD